MKVLNGRVWPHWSAVALVVALLLGSCASSDSDEATGTTAESTRTTEESTTTQRQTTSTTSTTTTTTIAPPTPAPPPGVATSPLETCKYLVQIDGVQNMANVEWVGIPTPPGESEPLLVLGFVFYGSRSTNSEMEAGERAFVAAALPFLAQVFAARQDLSSVVVVSSGSSFELSHKTVWQFTRAQLTGLTDVEDLARSAETAKWTQGRLPFTYLAPNDSRLDLNGDLIHDSACAGLA